MEEERGMYSAQDIVDMVESYRAEYPDLKIKVAIEHLETLPTIHGPGILDEVFDVIMKQCVNEIEVLRLVKIGVPFEEAVKQVFQPGGSADDEGPIAV
jgi:hypothetical protein